MNQIHRSKTLDFFSSIQQESLTLPYIKDGISAGFPSPAEDFMDIGIDLNKELVRNPSATFYGRVKGHSMRDMDICHGDLLVIDKSLEPQNGKVAVCYIDGEFTVKRIKIEDGRCWLMPANLNYQPIEVTADNDFMIWGIVIHVIKSL